MALQQRPPTTFMTKSLFCLLLMAIMQVQLFRCEDGDDTSASGYTCTPECGPGFECIFGLCSRQQCTQNCPPANDSSLVCGSNGVTYGNLCELEKARCEQKKDINVLYEGFCLTASPAPEQLCRKDQEIFDTMTTVLYEQLCNLTTILAKIENGTLQQSDLRNCYRPLCTTSQQFQSKQCGFVFYSWCWCVSPDGYAIKDTFQKNMPKGFCSSLKEKKCEVDGKSYDHLQAYTPDDFCGRCECLNGTHSCFVEYNMTEDGRLNGKQLDDLKEKLIQVYNFQHNHNDHITVDIRHILEYPVEVVSPHKETVLDWKFSHYNKNENFDLSPAEEYLFHREVGAYFGEGCSPIYDQLNKLMDKDQNKKITEAEWHDFFRVSDSVTNESVDAVAQPVKREAPLSPIAAKKPLNLRKKFRYVLY